jgi:hypothetical protein
MPNLADEFFVPDFGDDPSSDRPDPIEEYGNGELLMMKDEWLHINAGTTNGERIPEYSLSAIQKELRRRSEAARDAWRNK